MTNYAASRMTLVGPEDEILRFIETCCSVDAHQQISLHLEKAVPPPSRLINADGSISPLGDDWTRLNWGTKFIDGTQRVVERSEGRLVMTYDSPWGPPFVFNRILAERFPRLEIDIACYENGNDYGYRFHALDGRVDAREMRIDAALMRDVKGPDASDIPSQDEIDERRAAAPARLAAMRQAPVPLPRKRSVLRRILGLR